MRNAIASLKCKANKYKELKKQRGVTLLEIIIVLGIIGIIAAGVVVLAQRAFFTQDITDLTDSTNTIRTSAVDAFHNEANYPAGGDLYGITEESGLQASSETGILATMYKLGKISWSEVRNPISGDIFQVEGVKASAEDGDGTTKGFVVIVNGMDQEQCRSTLVQVANDWEYVQLAQAPAGANYAAASEVILDAPVTAAVKDAGIIRSLGEGGGVSISTATAANMCGNTSTNMLILGSR
ncbi:type IV pilus major pilin [Pseudescherichia vulneris]